MQKPLNVEAAGLDKLPGIRPEAQVNRPPVNSWYCQQLWGKSFEVDQAFSKRSVGTGLIVLQGAIAVDYVDRADPPM